MKNTTHLVLGLWVLTLGMEAEAQIQLPSVFSDGMVLQQNSKIAVWGWGNPSETLMILSEWNPGDTVRTVVDNQGRWKAEVPTGRAGGPYTLEVKGGNDSRKVSDVMLGEVWLCSGQSNMEWSADMGIMNGEQEVKQAACRRWYREIGYKDKTLQIPLRGLKAPYQVYYCFDEATIGSLRTDAGMPVLPFRTEKIEVK